MAWKTDLHAGASAEKMVLDKLGEWGFIGRKNPHKKPHRYDLEVDISPAKMLRLEVKNDKFAATSGNIALEYHNPKSDKPSGLYATDAEIWCHVIRGDEILFTHTRTLIDWITWIKPYKHFKRVGDNNAAIKLYKIEDMYIFKPFTKENWEEIVDVFVS